MLKVNIQTNIYILRPRGEFVQFVKLALFFSSRETRKSLAQFIEWTWHGLKNCLFHDLDKPKKEKIKFFQWPLNLKTVFLVILIFKSWLIELRWLKTSSHKGLNNNNNNKNMHINNTNKRIIHHNIGLGMVIKLMSWKTKFK